jgi:hydroxymethylpyrimidine/phosphomethylpyrimidine kinase
VVLDPILRSSSGAGLLDQEGTAVLRNELLRLADVITPNLEEASFLSGLTVSGLSSMEESCHRIMELGPRNIVVTGGHLDQPVDLLAESSPGKGISFRRFAGDKVDTRNTHGTGCAFSTAIACELALGKALGEAVRAAKEYVSGALRNSYLVGKGTSPVNHFFAPEREI